jgi:hypothetical protein
VDNVCTSRFREGLRISAAAPATGCELGRSVGAMVFTVLALARLER